MTPKELREHKKSPKRLLESPEIAVLKKGKLPTPFKTMGSSRLFATKLLKVSDTHYMVLMWRDGDVVTDTLFLGWLLCQLHDGSFFPLFEYHLHPSHKGIHAKTPCNTELNYTNRLLPSAPELNLKSSSERQLDPRNSHDRLILIDNFCNACGIKIGSEENLWNA